MKQLRYSEQRNDTEETKNIIECLYGNTTRQDDMTAVVTVTNAQLLTAVVTVTNAQLLLGGGVAGAIRQPAGPQLDRETLPLTLIKLGKAVIAQPAQPFRHSPLWSRLQPK